MPISAEKNARLPAAGVRRFKLTSDSPFSRSSTSAAKQFAENEVLGGAGPLALR